MIVGMRDGAKLTGISIVTGCAVLVCTMFLNFAMDMAGIKEKITSDELMLFYEAQLSSAKVISMVSGGCLLITSAIMLIFYIRHYVNVHQRELGILKALGYSDLWIAKSFWVFGLSELGGAGLGYLMAFLLMPAFYRMQNQDQILPKILIRFHPQLLMGLVFLPAVGFAALAVCFALCKLRGPILQLMRNTRLPSENFKENNGEQEQEAFFVDDLRRTVMKRKKTLVFFMAFASFCFSSMTQMSFQVKELASAMMGIMVMTIGIILACTTLILAGTTVINGNRKTIVMMKAFGYSKKECVRALLGGYRPVAFLGFVLGTAYQYILIRVMIELVFQNMEGIPTYELDVPVMLGTLTIFLILYEVMMFVCSEKMQSIPIKEIMVE